MGQLARAQKLYSEEQGAPPIWLRSAVREVLDKSDGFHQLEPEKKRSLAQAMVKVSSMAAKLIAEESLAEQKVNQSEISRDGTFESGLSELKDAPVLAYAQSQPEFGESANRIAGVTRNVLNAVSFPRFVTDLVNGVFEAMLNSTSQQMQMYVELLNNVSASVEGFEQTQFSAHGIRVWLTEQFPDAFVLQGGDDDFGFDDEDDEPDEDAEPPRLALRNGGSMPSQDAMRAVFGLTPGENISASNPEQLVPYARRQVARQRQQMLATMVQMGMQRIVIDSGKINASMRFHIDTRSAANQDRGREFGMQNRVKAAGRFGMGPWGASAEVENNISYVSTQRSQRTEEINTDLELNSSVELNFRTDYLPLNEMAAEAQADRIRRASLNPSAANDTSAGDRATRQREQRAAERERANRMQLNQPNTASTPLTPPASGSVSSNNQSQNRQSASSGTSSSSRSSPRNASGGSTSSGSTSSGSTSSGSTSSGSTSSGSTSSGSTSSGSTSSGSTSSGSTSSGSTSSGSTSSGSTSSGSTSSGSTSSGSTSSGSTSSGSTSSGSTSSGSTSSGSTSSGSTSSGRTSSRR
ncbi:hypothetical protein [Aliikangiella sp. G2MR2-5]|uniref:hypothetical protein n=1 Tax=Aliikangiella sp. G2MR2-5 TaxID=2788943 RepID=UPI0018A90274|nr:hypothetical protein [Aliikangiella sp. G2MR2-5]